jgi:hypothetical protein
MKILNGRELAGFIRFANERKPDGFLSSLIGKAEFATQTKLAALFPFETSEAKQL